MRKFHLQIVQSIQSRHASRSRVTRKTHRLSSRRPRVGCSWHWAFRLQSLRLFQAGHARSEQCWPSAVACEDVDCPARGTVHARSRNCAKARRQPLRIKSLPPCERGTHRPWSPVVRESRGRSSGPARGSWVRFRAPCGCVVLSLVTSVRNGGRMHIVAYRAVSVLPPFECGWKSGLSDHSFSPVSGPVSGRSFSLFQGPRGERLRVVVWVSRLIGVARLTASISPLSRKNTGCVLPPFFCGTGTLHLLSHRWFSGVVVGSYALFSVMNALKKKNIEEEKDSLYVSCCKAHAVRRKCMSETRSGQPMKLKCLQHANCKKFSVQRNAVQCAL